MRTNLPPDLEEALRRYMKRQYKPPIAGIPVKKYKGSIEAVDGVPVKKKFLFKFDAFPRPPSQLGKKKLREI